MRTYVKSLGHLRSLKVCVWVFVSAFSLRLAAQSNTTVVPDCLIAFNITTQGGTGPAGGFFDNRQVGCNSWQLQYGSGGFSAVSLLVQSSSDGTTPVPMGGTVVFGSNPLTSTTAASNLINTYGATFPAYARVIAQTATGSGTIRGILLGYRAAGLGGTGGGGGGTGSNGVVVGSGCNLQALFNLSSSGNTTIVSAGGTGRVRICEISFSTTATEDIKITEGTGVNCGTGGADVTGLYKSIQSMVLDPQVGAPIQAQTVGDDICLNQSGTQPLGGLVIYAKF